MERFKNEQAGESDDAFAERLAHLPLRSVPAKWREQILSAAHTGVSNHSSRPAPRVFWLETLFRQFPLSWAGLAAVWLFILAANRTDRWLNGTLNYQSPQLSAEQWAAIRAQRAELLVLAGLDYPAARERDPTDRRRDPVLRPRSGLRRSSTPGFGLLSQDCSTFSV